MLHVIPAQGTFQKPTILCAADLPVCPFEGPIQGSQGADEDVCRPQQRNNHYPVVFGKPVKRGLSRRSVCCGHSLDCHSGGSQNPVFTHEVRRPSTPLRVTFCQERKGLAISCRNQPSTTLKVTLVCTRRAAPGSNLLLFYAIHAFDRKRVARAVGIVDFKGQGMFEFGFDGIVVHDYPTPGGIMCFDYFR